MNVLVACEESQTVCKAFREKGHNAFSCDIQVCSGGHPEWHILGDVLDILEPKYCGDPGGSKEIIFFTSESSFSLHSISHWDLIIAHPPCTYLTKASASRLFPCGDLNWDRYAKGLAAKEFFLRFLNCSCPFVCVENPIPLKIFNLPKSSCCIQPYEFGDPWVKKTYLWLKGLPPLQPTNIIYTNRLWVSAGSKKCKNIGFCRSQKMRSKSFPGIANAMSEQWGELI